MALTFPKAPETTAAAPQGTDRPKAEFWLNIGMDVPTTDPATGEQTTTFISLPFGVALDTMSEAPMSNKNGDWNRIAQGKNWLRETLINMGKEGLEPGQADIVDGLTVQIRRVGEAEAPDAGDNPFLGAMQAMLKVVK